MCLFFCSFLYKWIIGSHQMTLKRIHLLFIVSAWMFKPTRKKINRVIYLHGHKCLLLSRLLMMIDKLRNWNEWDVSIAGYVNCHLVNRHNIIVVSLIHQFNKFQIPFFCLCSITTNCYTWVFGTIWFLFILLRVSFSAVSPIVK